MIGMVSLSTQVPVLLKCRGRNGVETFITDCTRNGNIDIFRCSQRRNVVKMTAFLFTYCRWCSDITENPSSCFIHSPLVILRYFGHYYVCNGFYSNSVTQGSVHTIKRYCPRMRTFYTRCLSVSNILLTCCQISFPVTKNRTCCMLRLLEGRPSNGNLLHQLGYVS